MYRQGDASAGAGQHHGFLSATTPSSSFSQTQFPSPLFALDPSLHSSPQHLHPGGQHGMPQQQTPDRRPSSESQGSMQPPASVSPRMNRTSSPAPTSSGTYRPHDRSLPSTNVTAENFTDAYVAFILYCSPHFPLDVDTELLRTTFNSPPKSDSKEFETFRLFELLKQFDAKLIKTWAQLALDLGVEAPDVNKGQSVQKVQQYTVRLKRWMRAMHIDAFFEYLLGKQHAYFTEIPHPSNPFPATGRDGVLAEEDLAMRALEPSFRPKRGRRRNSETEQHDNGDEGPASKHQRLHIGQMTTTPMSAYPSSAHPNSYGDPWAMASAVTPQSFAPWANKLGMLQTAMSATAPSHLRWHLQDNPHQLATPHPMTAQPTSMAAHIEAAFENEPKSAVTPARRRRKHGPAVSSAWPSAIEPGAKPRGRPAASRSFQHGPFSAFLIDKTNEKNLPQPKRSCPPVPPQQSTEATDFPQPRRRLLPWQSTDSIGRPKSLSLQVPQHTGGPVRLATPPPRMLLNGEANDSDSRSATRTPVTEPGVTATKLPPRARVVRHMQVGDRDTPSFAFEALKRILASDLLRGSLVGRQQRLSGDEAKRLADAALLRLGVPRDDIDPSKDNIARSTAASWLGLGEQLNVPLGPATSQGKRITVTRFRTDADGYDEILSAQDEPTNDIREVFDLCWTVTMGGCNGNFELKGLTIDEPPDRDDDPLDMILDQCVAAVKQIGNAPVQVREVLETAADANSRTTVTAGDDGIDWKQKYLALEFGARVAKGEMQRIREKVLQRVIEVLLPTDHGY